MLSLGIEYSPKLRPDGHLELHGHRRRYDGTQEIRGTPGTPCIGAEEERTHSEADGDSEKARFGFSCKMPHARHFAA